MSDRPSHPRPPTWIESDNRLARTFGRPIRSFLEVEASGGIALVAAAVLALVWANSPWRGGYETLFATQITLRVGSGELTGDLRHWIDDGLMALFFFVVGLEIKHELAVGDLRDRRAAALPVLAAVGGMVVPAGIYAAVTLGGDGAHGWGIPMATDIAFAVGVLALVGSRVPGGLKLLLLALAIVDDLGAILVIAVFYSGAIGWGWLAAAAAIVVLVAAMRRARVAYHPAYVVAGVALWWCVLGSGVHATLAGVVMGLLTPARPFLDPEEAEALVDRLEHRELAASEVRATSFRIRESVALTERLSVALHPWTSYVVVPVFALANAGIELRSEALTSPSGVTVGIVVGLVAGKLIGVVGATWLAVRLGWGRLPEGVGPRDIVGLGLLAGIGFTVSLFVTGLAFADDPGLAADAKVGILAASTLAAAAGATVLTAGRRRPQAA